jgi:hypothetical protein
MTPSLLAHADEVIEVVRQLLCAPQLLHLLTAASGTGPKSSALQRFRQVSEGLLPRQRGLGHGSR